MGKRSNDDRTLQQYANDVVKLVGGKITFACPNYAVVRDDDGIEHYLSGPASGYSWQENNRQLIKRFQDRLSEARRNMRRRGMAGSDW